MNFFQAHRPLLLGISQSGERQGHATSVHGEQEQERGEPISQEALAKLDTIGWFLSARMSWIAAL
jgi:hypothetical protein